MKEKKPGNFGAVQSVQFSPFSEQASISPGNNEINMLTDVTLQVEFELGRAVKTVRELLELKKGSVIGLNKLAGEYVDVLVNQQQIATGEVVVMDDKFAVRVTEVISDRDKEKKIR
ncbi:flagellar motor switch protein FliN [Neobacillus notoginsengisoli]|uniref:Flagellar motor switch protein FliN n=1 Tax=Neobacillus notoginsengisoli TaxID=1578198 RepID=A0A417YJG7_9BACI|nr:flagellar motor switch protein FliN [Neobacillus notoginsengisoli]RHW33304.1 flagellar motor switch protein FliN [Neobacillus notoginsengisoli]